MGGGGDRSGGESSACSQILLPLLVCFYSQIAQLPLYIFVQFIIILHYNISLPSTTIRVSHLVVQNFYMIFCILPSYSPPSPLKHTSSSIFPSFLPPHPLSSPSITLLCLHLLISFNFLLHFRLNIFPTLCRTIPPPSTTFAESFGRIESGVEE